jgi:hypothetical protein
MLNCLNTVLVNDSSCKFQLWNDHLQKSAYEVHRNKC